MYNIVYSTSDMYAPFMATSLYTLLSNNDNLSDVIIHILSNDITEKNKNVISKICEDYQAKCQYYDMQPIICDLKKRKAKLGFNPSSFIRIYLGEVLPEEVDRVLFIDSDTYVQNGIKELYELDLQGKFIGMVYDQPIFSVFMNEAKLDDEIGCFNAGVMLLDLKLWRENRIQGKLLDYFFEENRIFLAEDQSVINAVLAPETFVLDYKYNAMVYIFCWSYKKFCEMNYEIGKKTKEEFYEAQNKPVIIHFNGPSHVRPWEKWCSHPYTKKYRKALYAIYPDFVLRSGSTKQRKSFVVFQYFWHVIKDNIEKTINK